MTFAAPNLMPPFLWRRNSLHSLESCPSTVMVWVPVSSGTLGRRILMADGYFMFGNVWAGTWLFGPRSSAGAAGVVFRLCNCQATLIPTLPLLGSAELAT